MARRAGNHRFAAYSLHGDDSGKASGTQRNQFVLHGIVVSHKQRVIEMALKELLDLLHSTEVNDPMTMIKVFGFELDSHTDRVPVKQRTVRGRFVLPKAA